MAEENVPLNIRKTLMHELAKIEKSSELEQLTILSRSGMKIATAQSAEIDADPISGSSAALIDVSNRFCNNMLDGNLREIIIKAPKGYSILMYINNEFMSFAGVSNLNRIAYYLELLRVKCKYFSYILAGGIVTDELKKELEKEKKVQKEEDLSLKEIFQTDVSTDQDINAMKDVLEFLNEWGGEEVDKANENAIVSIDEELMITAQPENDNQQASTSTSVQKPSKIAMDSEIPFEIYEDEVPPIPLDDYTGLFEEESQPQTTTTATSISSSSKPRKISQPASISTEPKSNIKSQLLNFEDMPDFESEFASEYNDVDLELNEDDAFFKALADLGYMDKDEKKKSKN